jgi:hypothetical protein
MHMHKDFYKEIIWTRRQWFILVILAIWEAEIGRVKVQGQPRQRVLETPSPK